MPDYHLIFIAVICSIVRVRSEVALISDIRILVEILIVSCVLVSIFWVPCVVRVGRRTIIDERAFALLPKYSHPKNTDYEYDEFDS